ncbi:MAG: transglutaminase family protein, partial [Cyanobacteriota bacterium]
PPTETLKTCQGSCRDMAILFVDACRSMGMAARFVSGYQETDPCKKDANLHAWAEVYIPGGGWRGYDPSTGLLVTDKHVIIAASSNPLNTIPVSGTFRADDATSEMNFSITIETDKN